MNLLTKYKRKNHINETLHTEIALPNDSTVTKIDDKIEFFHIINDIINHEKVQKMKNFRQHCDTSCYEHCLHVAYYSYLLAKKLGLDYVSTARAAMLHDLFLYDWRKDYRDVELPGLHAFVHPKIALKNALEIFDLNSLEQDIIVKHMWPVTLALPKYKETYIVTLMDKYSALKESRLYFQSQLKKNKVYKYAYIFLSLIIFRIV